MSIEQTEGVSAPMEQAYDESVEQILKALGVTADDRVHFEAQGKPLTAVAQELQALTTTQEAPDVQDAARYDNGFLRALSQADYKALLNAYPHRVEGKKLAIFVPAAGAASRQFQMLKTLQGHESLKTQAGIEGILKATSSRLATLEAIESRSDAEAAEAKQLAEVSKHLKRFWTEGIVGRKYAFVEGIEAVLAQKGIAWQTAVAEEQIQEICHAILSREDGLGYNWLPKALLAFHAYPQGDGEAREARTALAEHIHALVDLSNAADADIRLHLAISQEHEAPIQAQVNKTKQAFAAMTLDIDWSFQAASTDSVAIDIQTGQLARRPDGTPLTRKAGHGALIENVANLDVDGIWIQNIDNILYQNPAAQFAVKSTKQLMASLAFQLQERTHQWLRELHDTETLTARQHKEIRTFAIEELGMTPQDARLQPESLTSGTTPQDARDTWIQLLDRPLVIAGYVPLRPDQKGGGPFVLSQSLNGILVHKTNTVEGAEFAGGQAHPLFQSGICFNPVNLFIAPGRHDGSRFDLRHFADNSRFFSSQKTDAQGKPIKVYERPGLWNGALAGALQLSIGILANTFSAVKDVAGPESFLSPLHQPGAVSLVTPLDLQRGIVTQDTADWLASQ